MTFKLKPIASTFGARVSGMDVRRIDSDAERLLRSWVEEYRMVVFSNQHLSAEEQLRFSKRFGALCRMPYIRPLRAHPEVIAVLKEADEVNVSTFGSWWHADFSYLEAPPVYSILQTLELPPSGGDTVLADMIGAYEGLSSGFRELISPLKVMHSGHIYGTRIAADGERGRMRGVEVTTGHKEADVERAHPLVRLYKPSGRGALFANPTYTTRLQDTTESESRALLDYIYQHFTQPDYTLRHRWRDGDLLVWDNRAVAHLAVNDYDGYRRLLHRTTVGRERPVSFVDRLRMTYRPDIPLNDISRH